MCVTAAAAAVSPPLFVTTLTREEREEDGEEEEGGLGKLLPTTVDWIRSKRLGHGLAAMTDATGQYFSLH